MNYKYHYVYRITNIVTEMYYYGDRSCNCQPSEDIGIKYFSTSSLKLFIQDQKENPQDYKYKVIKVFETCRKDAKQLEVDLHKKFDVKNHPKFINRANQSSKGFDTSGLKFVFSEEHKNKISVAQTLNNSFKGKHHTRDVRDKIVIARLGSTHSDETKNKMSISATGKQKSVEHRQNMSLACIGRIRSEESKVKQSKTLKNQFNPKKHNFSKHITIFNKDDEIMFECYGDFKKICIENNLPYHPLTKSRKTNRGIFTSKRIHDVKKVIRDNNTKYIGWYAKVID